MFDSVELGQSVDNKTFKEREKELRTRLLILQYRLLELSEFPVIIDFAGVEGAGKGATVNMLNTWMDPRYLRTIGYRAPNIDEQGRPPYWRFWRDLPPKGRTGLFLSGRYSQPLVRRVYDNIDDLEFDRHLAEIIRFENALVDDGALILKFWMHLSKDQQEERFKELAADPAQSYRITEEDRRNHERYEDFVAVSEQLIIRTNRGRTPWHIIEGADANHRYIRVGEIIEAELSRHLDAWERKKAAKTSSPDSNGFIDTGRTTVLDTLDLSLRVPKKTYRELLKQYQARLGELGREAFTRGLSTALVFEGQDAAGKGGAIRRTVWSLDARMVNVQQFAAPTDEERAHHYLWRFWRKLPDAGEVTVFDRSWYGRVLVERAEGFATEDEWRRAYNEINEFENQIVDHGTLLLKFWLAISKDEQLKRFQEREKSPYKHWKLTDEDWRNREQWDAYAQYAHDMIQYTSTSRSPWVLVEGDNKPHARLKEIKTVIDHLEQKIDEHA